MEFQCSFISYHCHSSAFNILHCKAVNVFFIKRLCAYCHIKGIHLWITSITSAENIMSVMCNKYCMWFFLLPFSVADVCDIYHWLKHRETLSVVYSPLLQINIKGSIISFTIIFETQTHSSELLYLGSYCKDSVTLQSSFLTEFVSIYSNSNILQLYILMQRQ